MSIFGQLLYYALRGFFHGICLRCINVAQITKDVTEENVTSVVKATGAEVNEAQVKALVASLADVDIEEAIKAAPVAVAAAPAAAAEADAPAGGDDKKEKKADPPSAKQEEQAMEGLASLFG